MALTALQRANVLAAIQTFVANHPHALIKAAAVIQRTRPDDGVVEWRVTVGRVTFSVDEQPADAAPADVLARAPAGKLDDLLRDRLANP